MFTKIKLLSWIVIFALVVLACGTFKVGVVETPSNIPATTSGPQILASIEITPIDTTNLPIVEPDFSHLCVEYRDPAYGYGVALPAHWVVNPTLPSGGAMTAASYDEAYFMAHSQKGWWTDGIIPEGVIKMDFAGMPDPYPDLDLETAISNMFGGNELSVVLSTETTAYNNHEAVLVTNARPDHLDEAVTSVAFRLGDGNLLLVTAFWGDVLHSPDVQAILASFVFDGESVTLPKIAPNPPLTGNISPSDPSTVAAVAWIGHIVGMPEGSQYDDFVLLSPTGAGEFGVTGSTPEIEAEIRYLRNAEGADEYVHLWGHFSCGVVDYNQCQLVVEKIHREGYIEDPVEGWIGTMVGTTFNNSTRLAFQLAGEVPMWYGIEASQVQALQTQLETLQDTGAIVQVWGEVMIGVPDVNGMLIELNRLEILQEGRETSLTEDDGTTRGWQTYTNDRFGYTLKYPSGTVIDEQSVVGLPTEEIPEGMTPDLYQEQLQKIYPKLCVGIQYDLGYIYISAPPNAGARYSPCGPTGVGSGETIPKTEDVLIGSQIYTAEGMEFVGDASTANSHLEMFSITLEDGTRIRYGGGSAKDGTYEDYLAKTKETLLRIMATYRPMVKRVYPFMGAEPGTMAVGVTCGSGFFGSLDEMVDVLTYNLEIGNYEPFSYSMGNPFVIGYWRSEGVTMTPQEALALLRNGIFPSPGKVDFTQDETQFPDLDGIPLASIWGPNVDIAANIFSTGWGSNQKGEAILVIARCSNATYYWHGILYAQNGFEEE